jgi:hypothetical protein
MTAPVSTIHRYIGVISGAFDCHSPIKAWIISYLGGFIEDGLCPEIYIVLIIILYMYSAYITNNIN